MARPRFEKADPEKKELLLQAAAREFASSGYEAASINRILEAAGLSKGAFYYYFDDKADLAATVLMWAYRDLLAMFEGLQAPDDGAKFWDFMRAFTRDSLAVLQRSPHANELVIRLGQAMVKDKDLAARITSTFTPAMAGLTEMWKRGQALGAVRSDLAVEVLVAILQGIKESIIRVLLPEGHIPTSDELQRIADIQLDLFRRVSAPEKEEIR